ncbi:4'-phosphopantetheinyl transferase family protein [Oceaniglobus indicus]|uniref:4'-phosphopantetheinyl transferase family protein n=1 Tax=Oceaniglobus indicus TaxID=2047749 RepID=UPI00130454D6|nr:4'-phosphopantetheinyl transferase superfamily protein [Oceaniglobus indicus]
MTAVHTPVPVGVRGLFPSDIAVALCDPRRPLGGLLGREGRDLNRMVDRRQREFTAGRYAARQAMAELGVPPQPVLPGADRAPIWPDGLVGSLSHDTAVCICAMGRSDDVRSIGVDVEGNTPLDGDLVETVCTADERDWLATQPDDQRDRLAKLLFSAKETAYKTQYPLTRALLDYHDIAVSPDLSLGGFRATFRIDVGEFSRGDTLSGQFHRDDDLIFTAMCLRPAAGA